MQKPFVSRSKKSTDNLRKHARILKGNFSIWLVFLAILVVSFFVFQSPAKAVTGDYNKGISNNTLTANEWNTILSDFVDASGDTMSGILNIFMPSGENPELRIQSVSGVDNHWAIYNDRTTKDLRFWNNDISGQKNLFTLTNEGRVGFNTISPEYLVDISGDARVTGTLYAGAFSGPINGTVSAINVSSGQFGANTGGGNYSFPSSVSIGTTSTSGKMLINLTEDGDAFQISSGNNVADLGIGNSTNSYGFYWRYRGDGSGNENALELWAHNQTGTDQQVYNIWQDGNIGFSQTVGIGTTTPGAKLDVNVNGQDVGLGLRTGAGLMGGLNIYSGSSPNRRLTAHSLDGFAFYTGAPGYTGGTERIRIDSSGNLGIGTVTPSVPLHVEGSGLFTDTVTVATPTADTHAATKGYVDSLTTDLDPRTTTYYKYFTLTNGNRHYLVFDTPLDGNWTSVTVNLDLSLASSSVSPRMHVKKTFNWYTNTSNVLSNLGSQVEAISGDDDSLRIGEPEVNGSNQVQIPLYFDHNDRQFLAKITVTGDANDIAYYDSATLSAGTVIAFPGAQYQTVSDRLGINLANDVMPTTNLDVNGTGKFTGTVVVATPTDGTHATTKSYVDSIVSGGPGNTVGYWTMNGTDIYNSNVGQVGIGTTTPSQDLEVVGTAWFKENATGSDGQVDLYLGAKEDSPYNPLVAISTGDVGQDKLSFHIDRWNGEFLWFTGDDGGGNRDAMRLNSDYNNGAELWLYDENNTGKIKFDTTSNSYFTGGNVGVGTNNPTYLFDVNGTSRFTQPVIVATPTDGTHATTKSYVDSAVSGATDTDWVINGNNQYSGVSGNVGIGTNNPSYKLDVNGNLNISGDTFAWDNQHKKQVAYRQGVLANSRHEVTIPWPSTQSGPIILDVEVINDTDSVASTHYVKKRFYLTSFSGKVAGSMYSQRSYVTDSLGGDSSRYYYIGVFENDTANGDLVLPIYSGANMQQNISVVLTAWGTDQVAALIDDATYVSNVQTGITPPSRAAVQAPIEDNFIVDDNLGVGATPSSYRLDVAGTGRFTNTVIVATPTADSHAATKSYVDSTAGGGIGAGTTGQTLRHDGSSWVANSVLYNNGTNIGINTTSPQKDLVVYGSTLWDYPTILVNADTTRGGAYLDLDRGSEGKDRAMVRFGESGTYTWKAGIPYNSGSNNSDFVISTNDALTSTAEFIIRSATGNVGINDNTPSYKLDVDGTGRFTGTVVVATPTGGTHAATKDYVDSALTTGDNDWAGVGGSPTLTGEVYHTGNVGIGTDNPSQALDVSGNIAIGADDLIRTSNNSYNTIEMYNGSDAGMLFKATHPTVGYFNFATNAGDVLRINTAGNVGIGTTTPSTKLEVAGNVKVGTATAEAHLSFSRPSYNYIQAPAGGTLAFVTSGNSVNDTNSSLVLSSSSDVRIGKTATTNGYIYLDDSADMVGIGTTAPAYTLDVQGTGGFTQPVVVATPTGDTHAATKAYVDSTVSGGTYWAANGNDIYNTNTDGVGIGTSTARAKLHVDTGTLYANNIHGQGTFTAGNENGFDATVYIGDMYKNVVQYSETNDSVIVLGGGSDTMDNTITNPTGSLGVIKLVGGTSNATRKTINSNNNFQNSGNFVVSFWMRKASGSQTGLYIDTNDKVLNSQTFNIDTDWKRFAFYVPAHSVNDGVFNFVDINGTNNGETYYLWGMQVESGDVATPYQKTEAYSSGESYGLWASSGGFGGDFTKDAAVDISSSGLDFLTGLTVNGNQLSDSDRNLSTLKITSEVTSGNGVANNILTWGNNGGLRRLTDQGGSLWYGDSSLVAHAGDNGPSYASNFGIGTTYTGEVLHLTADSQIVVATGLQSGYGSHSVSTFNTDGSLTLGAGPTANMHAATKSYVDSAITTGDSDWAGVGGDPTLAGEIYHTGNVGIGTTNPTSRFQVNGDRISFNVDSSAGATGLTINSILRMGTNVDYAWIQSHSSKPLVFNLLGNNVGINDTTPDYKLDVNGTGRFTNTVTVATPTADSHAATKSYVDSTAGGGVGAGSSGNTLRHNGTSWVANSVLYNNGTNIGINTTNPGAQLDVRGAIKTQNIVASSPDQSNYRKFINVASYSGGSAAPTGTLVVKLPPGLAHSMVKMKISGWSYGRSWDVTVAGYAHPGRTPSRWESLGGSIVTGNPPFDPEDIRLTAEESTDTFYVFLGDTSTSHYNYSHISVDVDSFYGNNLPSTGWDIFITSSEPNTDSSYSPTVAYYGSNQAHVPDRIGIGTTSPANPLAIYKDTGTYTPTAYNSGAHIDLFTSQSDGDFSGIRFRNVNANREAFFGVVQTAVNTGDFVWQGYSGSAYSEYARLKANGNFGISTNNPSYKLDVNGTGRFVQPVIVATPTASTHATTKSYVDGLIGGGVGSGTSGQTLRHDGSSWVANSLLYNDGTNIGVGTTSPVAKMHINNTGANSGGEIVLSLTSTNNPPLSTDYLGALWFGSLEGPGYRAAGIKGIAELDFNVNDTPAALTFLTTPDASGTPVERMRISSVGHVGIGTTDPFAFTSTRTGMHIYGTNASYAIHNSSANPWEIIALGDGSLRVLNNASSYPLAIASSNNIGINSNSPAYRLDVNGTSRFTQPVIVATPTGGTHATTKDYVDSALSAGDSDWAGVGGNPTLTGEVYHTGNVGIGTNNPSGLLDVYGGSTAKRLVFDNTYGTMNLVSTTDGAAANQAFKASFSASGTMVNNDTGIYPAILGEVYKGGWYSGNYLIGVQGNAGRTSRVGGTHSIGVKGYAKYDQNNAYTGVGYEGNLYGGYFSTEVTQVTGEKYLDNAYGVYIQPAVIGTNARINDLYGLYIASPSVSGSIISSRYGVYQADSAANNYFAGNVGIGTTDISSHSDFDNLIVGSKGSAGGITIFGSDSNRSSLAFGDSSSNYSGMIYYDHSSDVMHFTTNSDGYAEGGDEVSIDASGNVGIGDTSPSYKLEVAGTGSFSQPVIVATPTASTHATTKSYVDSLIGGGIGAGTTGQTLRHDGSSWVSNSVLYNNGTNVGIGTTSPGQKLEINGNIFVNNQSGSDLIYVGSTSNYIHDYGSGFEMRTSGASYELGFSSNSSITSHVDRDGSGSGDYNITTGGTGNVRFTVRNSGNVGIGTANPSTKLEVDGGFKAVSGVFTGSDYASYLTSGQANVVNYVYNNNTGRVFAYDGSSYYDLAIGDWNSGNPNIMLKTGGNVGINIGSPSYKLEVAGTGSFSQPVIVATPTASTHATTKSYVDSLIGGGIGAGTTGQTLRHDGTSWVSNSVLYNNGNNVGIGTTTMSDKLTVYGNIRSVGVTGDNTGFLGYNNVGNHIFSLTRQDGVGNVGLSVSSTNHIGFATAKTAPETSDYDMIINSTGNVGIGTTDPSYKLDVEGDIRLAGDLIYKNQSASYSNNYVRNSSFSRARSSSQVDDWTLISAGVNTVREVDGGRDYIKTSGEYSFLIQYFDADDINNIANRTFIMSADVKNTTGTGNILFYGYVQGSNPRWISWGSYKPSTTGIWERVVSDPITFATGDTYISQIRFYNYTNGNGDTMYFDNVKFEESSVPTLYAGSSEYIENFTTMKDSYFAVTSGNVGVGTATAGYKLDVNGTGRFNQPVLVATPTASGHATTKSYVDGLIGGGVGAGTTGQTLRHDGTSWVSNSVLYNNGTNIGIGTTNPGAKLEVQGGIIVDSGGGFVLGNTGETKIGTLLNDAGHMYLKGEGQRSVKIGGSTNGVNTFFDNVNNRVGIGTTSPTDSLTISRSSAPDLRLYATGGNQFESGRIRIVESANYLGGFLHYDGSTNTFNIGVHDASDSVAANDINAISMLRASGNVGINDTTPSYKLDVNGTSRFTQPVLVATPTASGHATTKSYVDGLIGGGVGTGATGQTLRHDGTSWVANSNLYNTGTNIGIGTSSPAHRLDVQAGNYSTVARFAGSHSSLSRFTFENTAGNNQTDLHVKNTAGNFYIGVGYGGTNAYLDNRSGGNLTFRTSGAEQMTLSTAGNLGIGSTTPSYKLDVNGTSRFTQPVIVATPTNTNHATTKDYVDTAIDSGVDRTCNNASISTAGWYRIASNGPVTDGGSGGDRAHALFNVWEGDSGQHSAVAFYASIHYGNNPSITLLSKSSYNTSGLIDKIRIVDGETYEGAAVEIYLDTSGLPGTLYYCYEQDYQASGWTEEDWTAGEVPTGFQTTVLNLDTTYPVLAVATGTGSSDDFYVTRTGNLSVAGTGSFGQPVTVATPTGGSHATTKDYVDSAAGGGVGAGSSGQTLRHDGTSWIANNLLYNNGTNIGIGTTNPTEKLLVNDGNIHINTPNTNSLGNGIRLNRPGATYAGFEIATNDSVDWSIGANSSGFGIYEDGLGANTRLIIKDGGNVGIGTTNPAMQLHVSNSVSGGGPFNAAHFSNNLGYGTGTGLGPVRISLGRGTSTVHGYIEAGAWSETNSANGYLAFGNRQNVNEINEVMRFDSTGDVGINDTTPSYRLDVNGTGRFTQPVIVATPTGSSHATTKSYVDGLIGGGVGTGTTGQTLRHDGTSWVANNNLYNNGTNVGVGTTAPGAKFEVYENGSDVELMLQEDAGTHQTRLHFRTGGNDTWLRNTGSLFSVDVESKSNALAITSAGNVGVGTASPSEGFHVYDTTALFDSSVFNANSTGVVVAKSVVELAGMQNVAQGASVSVTAGSLSYDGPTAKNARGRWTTSTYPSSITLHMPGSWWHRAMSFTSAYIYESAYPNDRLPKSFLIEKSTNGTDWTTIADETSHTKWYYYLDTFSDAPYIRITARAPQDGQTQSSIANLQVYTHSYSGTGQLFDLNGNRDAIFIGGEVGIGTINATSKLHVNGTGHFTNTVTVATPTAGTHATTKSYVDSLIGGGIGAGTTGQTLRHDGTSWVANTLLYNNGSDIGIGTTSVGSARLLVASASNGETLGGASVTDAALAVMNSDPAYGLFAAVSPSGFANLQVRRASTATYYDMHLQPYGGNVGIGTTSSSYKLDVNGSFRSNGLWTTASAVTQWGAGPSASAYGGLTWASGYATVYSTSGNVLHLGAGGATADMTINTSNNVGIGDTTPSYKLDVNGTGRFVQPVIVATPTGGTHAATKDYVDTAIASGDADWAAVGGGNPSLAGEVYHTGNVGIGTTDPGFPLSIKTKTGAPYTALEIQSYGTYPQSLFAGAVSNTGLFLGSGYYYNNNYYRTPGTESSIARFESGTFKIFTDNGLTANTDFIPTERMRVTANGNVGIGTTGPTTKLHVNGTVTASAFSGGLTGTVSAANVSSGAFGGNTGGGNYTFPASVGIGTTASSYALDIYGNMLRVRDDADAQMILVGTNSWAGIGFDDSDASGANYIWYNGSNQTFAIGGGGANVSGKKLHVDGAVSIGSNYDSQSIPTNGLRVEGASWLNGAVGIGTTDPGTYALKVVGNAAITGTLSTQTGADFAEEFEVAGELEPGTVVIVGDLGYKSVKACDKEYDSAVIGVVSGNPSMIAGVIDAEQKVTVAMVGVVEVKITEKNGIIKKGDLLTTSSVEGYAMKAKSPKTGTIIGKALEDMQSGDDTVMALINLQ